MGTFFNIACFTLSVAVAASAACAVVRIAGVRKELQENESRLLFRRARNGADEKEGARRQQTQELTGLPAKLADAGIALSPVGWRTAQTSTSVITGVFVFMLESSSSGDGGVLAFRIALAVTCSIAVALAFRKSLAYLAAKRVLLLEKQLAQIELQIAENSRSGLSVGHSIMACTELADEPLKGHLRRLYNEITYSDTTLAEGFANMARRTGSSDAKLLADVVAVQQQTGSNLADALDFLHETIARRLEMRQSLRNALAETKITRTIVGITPWAVFAMLSFAPVIRIRGFWEFYSTNPLGWGVLLGCVVVEAAILAFINRMANLRLD